MFIDFDLLGVGKENEKFSERNVVSFWVKPRPVRNFRGSELSAVVFKSISSWPWFSEKSSFQEHKLLAVFLLKDE